MLKEFKQVRQTGDKGHRRWFTSGAHELIIWYDDAHEPAISGFQLCYPAGWKQYAFTWTRNGERNHQEVDTGSAPPFAVARSQTPILVADGVFPAKQVSEQFLPLLQGVDESIVNLVSRILEEEVQRQATGDG